MRSKAPKSTLIYYLSLFLLFLLTETRAQHPTIVIADHDKPIIGQLIWQNESNATFKGLSHWNKGERFAAMGIAHFSWYPMTHGYQGTFPRLLAYMQQHGATLPPWLQQSTNWACPWPNRANFMHDFDHPKMVELRYFLANHITLQVNFLLQRLEMALPLMQVQLSPVHYAIIEQRFYQLAQTPAGIFAMLDYINFKGAGLQHPPQQHGWGLLQVLDTMAQAPMTLPPLQQFIWSADHVLTRRVHESPPKQHTKRWLKGWRARVYRYGSLQNP